MHELEDLTWLTGKWKGNTDDGIVEEHWSEIEANTMMGMFRWIKNSTLFIYESMALVQRKEGIKLYLRHFDDYYKGWESRENPLIYDLKNFGDKMVAFEKQSKMDESYIKYKLDNDKLNF